MRLENFPLAERDKVLLENKIHKNTLVQTLLIEGADRAVRLALAKEIANALVCVGEGEKPCGHCRACVKTKANSHPDIKIYAPPKKNATFKVEVCREIRHDAFIVPNDGHNKVYILEESQNMNDSAENALLKVLEEPPKDVFFILTCESAVAMLPTILSRAMVLRLLEESREVDEEHFAIAKKIAESLASGFEMDTLLATAAISKDREAIKEILSLLSSMFTFALLYKNGKSVGAPYFEIAPILANHFTEAKLYALCNTADALALSAKRNANANLLLTSLCYQFRRSIESM